MKQVRTLFILTLIVFLSGCSVVTGLSEMHGKMQTVNDALKEELNMDAQVGWNIHNGTLTQITVILPAEGAGGQTIQQLKEITYPIVMQHFDAEPQSFQIAVLFTRKK